MEKQKHLKKRARERFSNEKPGNVAGVGSPSVLEVLGVGPAVLLAVELGVDEGARGGFVERVGSVHRPFALEKVAPAGLLAASQGGGVRELLLRARSPQVHEEEEEDDEADRGHGGRVGSAPKGHFWLEFLSLW